MAKEHIIDAENKKLGRVATEAARILIGKDSVEFAKNKVTPVSVVINNASRADISEKKKIEKEYKRYSGYPGGLKHTSMKKTIEKKGYAEIFRKAVDGMLPKNKLRSLRLKNLTVNE